MIHTTRMSTDIALLSLLFLTLGMSPSASGTPGQPGTPDTSYGSVGTIITAFSGEATARATVLQPDGKAVVVGECAVAAVSAFCALRYTTAGALDPSFGTGGEATTAMGSGGAANAVAVLPDGKLVLAGTCSNGSNKDFCALRYNPDGSLDTSFGANGKVITNVGTSNDIAITIALQPDGKVVLAGSCFVDVAFNFCAARYLANGMVDTTFGSGGTSITALGSGNNGVVSVAVQPDGKLVLAGYCTYNTNFRVFCALRYDSAGALDNSFGTNGAVFALLPAISRQDYATTALLQPDGKLVMAGYCQVFPGDSQHYHFCTVRFQPNGTLDMGFGSGGTVLTPLATDDYPNTISLQPDGKLILAGRCVSSSTNFCAVRYHTNGFTDTSFGGNGLGGTGSFVTTIGSGTSEATTSALQADGKLLLAGYCVASGTRNFCAARYDGGPFGNKNCSLDLDGDGRVLATTDLLIGTRVALGLTGTSVLGGVTFSPAATRNTWPLIREYLVTQCGMSLTQ